MENGKIPSGLGLNSSISLTRWRWCSRRGVKGRKSLKARPPAPLIGGWRLPSGEVLADCLQRHRCESLLGRAVAGRSSVAASRWRSEHVRTAFRVF